MKKLLISLMLLTGTSCMFGADDSPQVRQLYAELRALAFETIDLTLQAGEVSMYKNGDAVAKHRVYKTRADVQEEFFYAFDQLKPLLGTAEIIRRLKQDLPEKYHPATAMLLFHDLTRDSDSDSDID